MSLILEALKKLEREKQAPDRGFLVMAHVPWAAASAGRARRWLWLAAALGALALSGLAFYRYGASRPPTPAPVATTPPPAVMPLAVAPVAPVRPPAAPVRPASSVPPRPETSATPTAPSAPETAAHEGVELRLNAISQQDGRPVAILNDRLVREGDSFGDIRVVRIGESEVEVEVKGKRRIVRF